MNSQPMNLKQIQALKLGATQMAVVAYSGIFMLCSIVVMTETATPVFSILFFFGLSASILLWFKSMIWQIDLHKPVNGEQV